MTINPFPPQAGFIGAKLKPKTLADTVLANIARTDPDLAQKLKQKRDETASLVERLQSQTGNASAEKKENARRKIEQLKAQIASLRLMSAVNPKAAARQAAQLARELAAAVKEYGGGGANVSRTVTTAAPSANNANNVNAATATAEAATIANPPEGGDAEHEAQNDETAAANPQLTAAQKKLGVSDEDSQFAAEARRLLNQLKDIVKKAKDKQAEQGKSGGDQDFAEASKALHEAQGAISDIETGAVTALNAAINLLA